MPSVNDDDVLVPLSPCMHLFVSIVVVVGDNLWGRRSAMQLAPATSQGVESYLGRSIMLAIERCYVSYGYLLD